MTYELTLLALNVLLCLAFPWVYNYAYAKQPGVRAEHLTGNRDDLPERKGMAARGLRAHQNHLENLLPFAILVLIAHGIGVSNTVTATCSTIFFLSRLAHAGLYIAGISSLFGVKGVRSIVYLICVLAMLVYAAELFLA